MSLALTGVFLATTARAEDDALGLKAQYVWLTSQCAEKLKWDAFREGDAPGFKYVDLMGKEGTKDEWLAKPERLLGDVQSLKLMYTLERADRHQAGPPRCR